MGRKIKAPSRLSRRALPGPGRPQRGAGSGPAAATAAEVVNKITFRVDALAVSRYIFSPRISEAMMTVALADLKSRLPELRERVDKLARYL